jgi:ABC-type Fe3+ transport system substrate-binding protein
MKKLHYWGFALAPNSLMLKEHLEAISEESKRRYGVPLDFEIPGKTKSSITHPEDEWTQSSKPEVCAMVGLGPLLRSGFRNRYITSSSLVARDPDNYSRKFDEAGCRDPLRIFTIYSVSPFIMLVNVDKLKGVPVPKKWLDLADPAYRGQIVITPEDTASNIAFFSMYKMYGRDVLRGFMDNVLSAASASVMPVMSLNADVPGAICICPWFFAKVCPRPELVSVVWPEEGALTFPLWFMADCNLSAPALLVVDFLTGASFADESLNNCLPTAHLNSDKGLGTEQKFNWPGWDFIRNLDVEQYTAMINELTSNMSGFHRP